MKIFSAFPIFVFLLFPVPGFSSAVSDIQVDQTGYLPAETKLAMVTHVDLTGSFIVRRVSDGSMVFTGSLSPAAVDPNSGLSIQRADFSPVTNIGNYVLDVAGLGQSYPFSIDPNVYARAFYMAARFYYGQRCGIAVNLAPTFPGYRHEACHQGDGIYDPSAGVIGTKKTTRGWHDAGDYGKYVVNSGISTGELLWTYDWFSEKIGGVNLQIPESGNGVPDLLNEARWNLEWMLAMQDSDGGVWPKVTTARFDPFEMPELDSAGPRFIIGKGSPPYKTTAATADFAAVMALAARLYHPFDPVFSETCVRAAVRAWSWIQLNPQAVFASNPSGISTGGYGDGSPADECLWAAAELFRTTGESNYNDYFTSHLGPSPFISPTANAQSWANVRNLALWAYYFSTPSGKRTNSGVAKAIREDTLAAANAVTSRQDSDGYRVSLAADHYNWGSNGGVGNFGIMLLMANAMKPDPHYVQAVLDDIHYLLGRNGNKISFVTQLGTTYPLHPHHRPSGSDANILPWPGMLVGGPNRYPSGDRVTPSWPSRKPALCYLDVQGAYGCNEVAINWNAPLVFILAANLKAPSPKTAGKSVEIQITPAP